MDKWLKLKRKATILIFRNVQSGSPPRCVAPADIILRKLCAVPRNRHPQTTLIAVVVSAVLASSPAAAHTGTGLAGGFQAGFLHPFGGFDHLLAMVSVGVWGAFLGRPLIAALPVIFPTVMAFGALLGMAAVPMPPVEVGVALSVLVLGSLIAFAVRPPVWAACVTVAAFAVFHGYAHGQELPSAADPIGYSAGFVLATGLLHVAGIGIGMLKDRPGGTFMARGLGALIALAGLGFLLQAASA